MSSSVTADAKFIL